MSELYLDTEVRWYFPRIALRLTESGYSRDELDDMFRYEVTPICYGNLRVVAGEWASFDDDAIATRIVALRGDRRQPAGAWQAKVARFHYKLRAGTVAEQWSRVLDLYTLLCKFPESGRTTREKVWTAFAHFYIERDLAQMLFPFSHIATLATCGLSLAQVDEAFTTEFEPIYCTLLEQRSATDPTPAAARATWRCARQLLAHLELLAPPVRAIRSEQWDLLARAYTVPALATQLIFMQIHDSLLANPLTLAELEAIRRDELDPVFQANGGGKVTAREVEVNWSALFALAADGSPIAS